jgi:hypothetical protein
MCKCNLGLKRHPTTLICDWECPNGFEANATTRLCEKIDPHPLELKFTDPWTTSYCHPPTKSNDRGAYFDGVQSSFKVDNFEIYREFSVQMWARVNNTNATLVSMRDVPMWSGQDSLKYHKNTCRWSEPDHECYIELSISPCN